MYFHGVLPSVRETLLSKLRTLPLNPSTLDNVFPWKKSKCEHYIVKETDFLEYLLKVLQENWKKDTTMEYLKKSDIKLIIYDINERYEIESHTDNCDKTLIFYLQKDSSIHDNIFFDVTPDCKYMPGDLGWEYGLSEFNGDIIHGGPIHGSGLRVLLSIHH